MKVIILAAGEGKNLTPLTETRPKPMIEICGEPLIARILRSIKSVGLNQVKIVVGHCSNTIINYCQQSEFQDLSLSFSIQKTRKGVGNAILQVKDWIEKNELFLLIYGDILYSDNMIKNLINSYQSIQKPLASVSLTRDATRYGNIYMDADMRITDIIEKPTSDELGNYILAGAFILPGTFIKYLSENNENMIAALKVLSKNEGFFASIWEGKWLDIKYPWDILSANRVVMNEWTSSIISSDIIQEPGSLIEGPVFIEKGVIIKAGAHILGPCFIGENSFIGHSALVRSYTSIGTKSIVGFGVEMKNSVLFHEAEIGRLSFIGDSIIGEKVNIGSGAVMVNINMDLSTIKVQFGNRIVDSGLKKLGSMIGDGCWIGAGHTFLPGTRISSGLTISHNVTYHP